MFESSDEAQYSVSLYWSLYTVTSIGYGNIYPKTSIETCWAIVMMMAAAFFCDAGITAILSYGVETMDSKSAFCNEKISTAMKYVKIRGASKRFLERTKQCYSDLYISNFGIDEAKVFKSLSFATRNEILLDTVLPSIRRHKSLQILLRDDYGFVIYLVNNMLPRAYHCKESIRHPYCEWPGLLYILAGSVACATPDGRISLIPCGTLMGDACLTKKSSGRQNGNEIFAKSFCETYILCSRRYKMLLKKANQSATNESNLKRHA